MDLDRMGRRCPVGWRATISRLPVADARSCVKDAMPQWRGGYVETNAVRTMTDLLSIARRRRSKRVVTSARSKGPNPMAGGRRGSGPGKHPCERPPGARAPSARRIAPRCAGTLGAGLDLERHALTADEAVEVERASSPPRWKKYSFSSSAAMKPKPRSETTFLMVPVVMRTSNTSRTRCKTHGPSEKGVDHAEHRHECGEGPIIAHGIADSGRGGHLARQRETPDPPQRTGGRSRDFVNRQARSSAGRSTGPSSCRSRRRARQRSGSGSRSGSGR